MQAHAYLIRHTHTRTHARMHTHTHARTHMYAGNSRQRNRFVVQEQARQEDH